MRHIKSCALLVVLGLPLAGTHSVLEAQPAQEPASLRLTSQGPPASVGPASPQVIIQAGQGDEKGEIVVTTECGFGFKLSAPLDKKTGLTSFANLDGLANNLSLAGTWRRPLLRAISAEELTASVPAKQAVCRNHGIDEESEACSSDGALEAELRERGASSRQIRDALLAYDKATFGNAWTWVLLAEGKAGYKQFEFFDNLAKKQDSDEISTSLSFSAAGVYGPGRLLLSATYQQAFEDGKTAARSCSSIADAQGLETCEELPLGPPVEKDGVVLRVELRHIFGFWGVGPELSWDEHADVFGVQLPIYFLTNSDGVLNGGFRLGWRDDTDDLNASVFVSKPLSLF